MKSLISSQSLLVKILSLLLLMNLSLLANSASLESSTNTYSAKSSTDEESTGVLTETVEVSLDSFTNMGILIMIVLSSLLGAFFVKDEFSTMLKS